MLNLIFNKKIFLYISDFKNNNTKNIEPKKKNFKSD